MTNGTDATLLRIYVKESDQQDGQPLHLTIVEEARKQGLAGATVLRGLAGFGSSSAPATEVSSEVPIIIEIVDWGDNVTPFVDKLSRMLDRGLITTEQVIDRIVVALGLNNLTLGNFTRF